MSSANQGLLSTSRRAQEAVFRSDDLISEIFEYLTIDPRFVQSGFDTENYKKLQETRKHLRNAALVCRNFSEPALNLLWRSMESLTPLLKLLAGTYLEISNGQYVISGAVSRALYISSFNKYATRIRIFVHHPALYEKNRNTSYAWLPLFAQSALVGTCILPRLDTLVISHFELNDNQVVALLSPSLRRVDITWLNQESWPTLITLFSCLLSCIPKLHHLTYHGRLVPKLHRVLSSFTELRSLEVGNFLSPRNSSVQRHWTDAINTFSSLTYLRRLSLDILDYDSPKPTLLYSAAKTLPLTHLRLQSRPSPLVHLKLLERVMGSLQEIRLDLSPNINVADADIKWDDFTLEFDSLCKIWGNLRSLTLVVGSKFSDFPTSGSLDSLFNPILQLFEITHLDVNFRAHKTTISEDLAFKVIGSYPRLKHLNILFHGLNISHDKLAKLATLCPHLLHLGIGIRLDKLTKENYHPQYPALDHPLRTLSTSNFSPQPQNYHVVTRCLLRLFPDLDKIETTAQSGWETGVLQLMELARNAIFDGHNRSIPRPPP